MNRKIIRDYEDSHETPDITFSQNQQDNAAEDYTRHNFSSGKCGNNYVNRSTGAPVGSYATPQSRLIAFLLDAAIFGFGLGIVWIIWFVTLADKGTTPGHFLMGQVVVDVKTGETFGWKKMVIREILIKGLLHWILGGFLFMANYIVDGSFIFTSTQRTLHDLMIGSHVVQCSEKTLIKKLRVEEIDGWLNK